jgi:predicted metal-dependent peptidase
MAPEKPSAAKRTATRTLAASALAAEEHVSRAIIALYMAEPFFAHVVQGLVRRVDASTPTAAVALVGSAIELWVNPEFFASLGKNMRVAVIKHEVLHVVLKHLLRGRDRNPLLWNLACDVVVNALVGKWPLPEGAVTHATFPDLKIPADATADQVYALLRALQREMDAQPPGGDAGSGEPDYAATSAPASARALHRLGAAGNAGSDDGAVGGHSDHSAWDGRPNAKGGGGAPDGAPNPLAAEAGIDGMVVRAADRTDPRSWGSLPGLVRDAVMESRARGVPKVDWKRALRLFACATGRTKLKSTQRRESTRYGNTAALGTPPDPRDPTQGRLVPGIKIQRLRSVLVAVDTSGSIGEAELEAFFNEIHGVWRSGAAVYVLGCDAAVHDAFEYQGKAPVRMGGGGGTAFEPVFAWMAANRARRFDGVIYLTDGYGPAPETKPPCRVLWVVTAGGLVGEHLLWGRHLVLEV